MPLKFWIDRLAGKSRPTRRHGQPFDLHQYLDDSGFFDYDQYRKIQVATNKRKLNKVWVQEENVDFLSSYLERHLSHPRFGLCHGVRRGLEQKWFRERLRCDVLGTEISDTASDFPHTIQWDFHDVKPEWTSAVDFIYSNSLDHSYDPEKCVNAWTSCLRPNGILVIEHSPDDVTSKESDPFGAPLHVMPYLILQWTNGAYCVREILDGPTKAQFGKREYPVRFLIVRKNDVCHAARDGETAL